MSIEQQQGEDERRRREAEENAYVEKLIRRDLRKYNDLNSSFNRDLEQRELADQYSSLRHQIREDR